MSASMIELGALVADIGSFAAKIGFAGDDAPKAHFPSLVGITNNSNPATSSSANGSTSSSNLNSIVNINNGNGNKSDIHFDLFNFRQHMAIANVTKDGVIADWDAFERLWEHANKAFLKVDYSETPVFMSEKPYNPSSSRQKLTEIMFEKFNTPAFFLSKDSVMSCYACGKTSGLVVDVGAQGTTLSGVIDGWVDPRSINRSCIGGRVLDAYMLALLKQRGFDPLPLFRLIKTVTQDKRILVSRNPNIQHVHPTYDALMKLEIGRDIKESVVQVAERPLSGQSGDLSRYSSMPLVPYELPDGNVVDLGLERYQASELLFDPSPLEMQSTEMQLLSQLFGGDVSSLSSSSSTGNFISNNNNNANISVAATAASNSFSNIPATCEGIAPLAVESVRRCDLDQHATLWNNLVVTGGTATIERLPDRIKADIEMQLLNLGFNHRVKMISASTNARALTCWVGGSIVASMGSLHEMWVSKQEYQEYGAAIIDRKCP